jgi:hypothetical protein
MGKEGNRMGDKPATRLAAMVSGFWPAGNELLPANRRRLFHNATL